MKTMLIKNQRSTLKKMLQTKFVIFLMLLASHAFGQSESLGSTVFSFTPRTRNVEKVNGLAIGLGLNIDEGNTLKEINGLNLQVNPVAILVVMFHDPSRDYSEIPTAAINGISIGIGEHNINENITHSGLEVALFNSGYACNGISVNLFYNYVVALNGVHVAFVSNYSKKANGLFIAFNNDSKAMTGLQLGLINNAEHLKGLQIGVYNKSKTQKGLQLGFWNSNNKRSLPFINW